MANLPRDTEVYKGTFIRYDTTHEGTYWVPFEYESAEDEPAGPFKRTIVTGWAAQNHQETDGNGIEGVFATEAEAESYLIERFGDEDLAPDMTCPKCGGTETGFVCGNTIECRCGFFWTVPPEQAQDDRPPCEADECNTLATLGFTSTEEGITIATCEAHIPNLADGWEHTHTYEK